jgi:hypothetical protein
MQDSDESNWIVNCRIFDTLLLFAWDFLHISALRFSRLTAPNYLAKSTHFWRSYLRYFFHSTVTAPRCCSSFSAQIVASLCLLAQQAASAQHCQPPSPWGVVWLVKLLAPVFRAMSFTFIFLFRDRWRHTWHLYLSDNHVHSNKLPDSSHAMRPSLSGRKAKQIYPPNSVRPVKYEHIPCYMRDIWLLNQFSFSIHLSCVTSFFFNFIIIIIHI